LKASMSYVAVTNVALVFFATKYAVTMNVTIAVNTMAIVNLECCFTVNSNGQHQRPSVSEVRAPKGHTGRCCYAPLASYPSF